MIDEMRGIAMRLFARMITPLVFATVLAAPIFLAGCENKETVYYNRWERETHREHVELNRRAEAEQREYADWRRRADEHH
jgi:hypothetical protein